MTTISPSIKKAFLYNGMIFTILSRSHVSNFFENPCEITLVIKVKPGTNI